MPTLSEDAWVKEFRFANEESDLSVLMTGRPTAELLDTFIETLISLRNDWLTTTEANDD